MSEATKPDPTTRVVRVFENLEALSRAAADMVLAAAREAVAARGRFSLSLSGGSTPRGAYRLLAQAPYRDAMPWAATHLFWGDERCVPVDHPESTFGMVNALLLSQVNPPPANIHRARGEAPNAADAADEYQAELRRFFHLAEGEFPRFDLVLLGLGDDGHTASLYPGAAGLAERRRLVVAHFVAQRSGYRLTFTVPALQAARAQLFLVAGREKVPALRQVLRGAGDRPPVPAQLVTPTGGLQTWLVDRAAAAGAVAAT